MESRMLGYRLVQLDDSRSFADDLKMWRSVQ